MNNASAMEHLITGVFVSEWGRNGWYIGTRPIHNHDNDSRMLRTRAPAGITLTPVHWPLQATSARSVIANPRITARNGIRYASLNGTWMPGNSEDRPPFPLLS